MCIFSHVSPMVEVLLLKQGSFEVHSDNFMGAIWPCSKDCPMCLFDKKLLGKQCTLCVGSLMGKCLTYFP